MSLKTSEAGDCTNLFWAACSPAGLSLLWQNFSYLLQTSHFSFQFALTSCDMPLGKSWLCLLNNFPVGLPWGSVFSCLNKSISLSLISNTSAPALMVLVHFPKINYSYFRRRHNACFRCGLMSGKWREINLFLISWPCSVNTASGAAGHFSCQDSLLAWAHLGVPQNHPGLLRKSAPQAARPQPQSLPEVICLVCPCGIAQFVLKVS